MGFGVLNCDFPFRTWNLRQSQSQSCQNNITKGPGTEAHFANPPAPHLLRAPVPSPPPPPLQRNFRVALAGNLSILSEGRRPIACHPSRQTHGIRYSFQELHLQQQQQLHVLLILCLHCSTLNEPYTTLSKPNPARILCTRRLSSIAGSPKITCQRRSSIEASHLQRAI